MNEKLTVNNFLVIKKASLEIKKINIVIGPQANGKSLLAKLLHFFKSINLEFIECVRTAKAKRELDKNIIAEFEKKFPRYAWDGTSFSIGYEIEDLHINLIGKKNASNKTKLEINYSSVLIKQFSNKKKIFAQRMVEARDQEKPGRGQYSSTQAQVLYEHVIEPLRNEQYGSFFTNPIFIPATRSFFANLQKNIFTFLASNLDIDPYLKDFGSLYENSKRLYKDKYLNRTDNEKITAELYAAVESIISGEYEYHDEKDWIVNKGRKINLVNASSGQQESLPMLLALCVWPILRSKNNGFMCFIEEPEAHLFPTSQGQIVSILSTLYKKVGTSFFITTHSPYIIAALNNFILAADKIKNNAMELHDFIALNGSGMPINLEDVSAYTISNGEAHSISDAEYRIIGADMLDEISEHFESVMNNMLIRGSEN
jgi:predicted ATPase